MLLYSLKKGDYMLINGKNVNITYEKIKNYNLYRTYKAYMKKMQSKNMDLTYPDQYVDVIEEVIFRITELESSEIECNDESRISKELDEIAVKNFSEFFNGPSMFIFRNLVKSKNIDPDFPFDACDLETRNIILKHYESLGDLRALFYQMLHILVYQKNKKVVESEIFPQAFKLIIADYLDSITEEGKFVKSTLSTQIEEFKYNNYVNLLYPSLTPVFLPYAIGSYLGNEVYLAFKKDREGFISHFKKILDGYLSIPDYLELIGSALTEENIDKVIENYQIVLK